MQFGTLEDAISFAAQAHMGQTDHVGQPYILHVLRVMLQMPDNNTRIAAALHDVVEDTPVTLEQLHAIGFAKAVVDAVGCLTHRQHEPYSTYIDRVRTNAIAKTVKAEDIADNLNSARLALLDDATAVRLLAKYTTALEQLLATDYGLRENG